MQKHTEHVAIIPDGNRRWAKEKSLHPWKGHYEGMQRIEEIVKNGKKLGITHLTIWGGSYNNLTKRTKREISVLDTLYRKAAKKLLHNQEFLDSETRVRFIGEWQQLLKKETVKSMQEVEFVTKGNSRYNLTGLIGYNGNREMLSAIKSIIKNHEGKIQSETIKKYLWTHDLPPVDLVIRTGAEPHFSNGFMMWDIQDAHFHFSNKMWPDFNMTDLHTIIQDFRKKERRFGS